MQKKLILSILSLVFSLSAWAQSENVADSTSVASDETVEKVSYSGVARKFIIDDIVISGVQHMDHSLLVNLSGLSKGQEVSIPGDDITQAVKRYLNNGLFSDVKMYYKETTPGHAVIEVALKERPRLSDVRFHGLSRSDVKDVRDKVAMMEEAQVTPFLIKRAEKYVREYFVGKGFYNCEVKVIQLNDPENENHVILDINVDKKDKVKVKHLRFHGNKVMTYRQLNKAMKKTNQKGLMNFFRTKKFVKELYEKDLEALVEYYNERGYHDARVVSEKVVRNDDGKTVDIDVEVFEGEQYFLGDVSWVGNSLYTGDYLSHILRMKRGDIYDTKKINKRLYEDDDAVHNLYMDNGYLFSNITPVEIRVSGDTIDLEMRVVEGTQATINEVVIRGNNKTNEHVVRREIRTKPGQLFSKSELIRSVRELAQLGHFDPETINPVPVPNYENGTVDLVYNLEEKSNDQIEISGGWGAGMFVGSIGVSFNNFSIQNIFNKEAYSPLPTGDGQRLSLKAQANGKYYRNLSFSFTEPWLGGKRPNSFSVSAFYSSQTGVSSSYYNNFYNGYSSGYSSTVNTVPSKSSLSQYRKVSGFSVGLGKRLTWPDDWFVLSFELSYQHYRLRNWQYFLMQNGQSHNIALGVTLYRNSLDNPIYTRSGSYFSIGVKLTPPYSAFSDRNWRNEDDDSKLYKFIEYHKWSLKGQVFKPITPNRKLVLMAKFEMGFLGYYNRYKKSPFEKYVMGGDGMSGYSTYGEETIALRGYENSSLTPRATSSYSYDGNIYNKYTMELRFPITLQPQATVYVLGFAEAGNCWSKFEDYSPFDLKRSAGFGVRIFLPIFGLLGMDWGYGFDEVSGYNGAGGSQFHFVMGQSF